MLVGVMPPRHHSDQLVLSLRLRNGSDTVWHYGRSAQVLSLTSSMGNICVEQKIAQQARNLGLPLLSVGASITTKMLGPYSWIELSYHSKKYFKVTFVMTQA